MPNFSASALRLGLRSTPTIMSAPTRRAPCIDVEADAAEAEHDDVGARLDLGGVDHGADAGGDAAADVADLVERRVLADLRDRDLRHDGEVRERRGAHVVKDRLAAEREAAGAVGHQALALRRADRLAEVGLRRQAVLALRGTRACRAGSRGRPSSRSSRPRRPRRRRPRPRGPRIAGKRPSGSSPESVNSSVWQMPVALISTSTSPARGPSSSTVSIDRGLPGATATAALTSMAAFPYAGCALT